MKMNKKHIVSIAIFAALIVPLACSKKFLNQTDTRQTTADAFFNTPSDGVALVNGIYDTYQNADLLKKSIWYYANFQTHDFFNWGNDRAYNIYQIPTDFG